MRWISSQRRFDGEPSRFGNKPVDLKGRNYPKLQGYAETLGAPLAFSYYSRCRDFAE